MDRLKILVVTQKVDENDSIVGFFCGWLNKLAERMDKIYVLTLEKGKTDLAKNIELYSLGKENGSSKLRRFVKFNYVIAKIFLNKRVDIIFLHMCPEYVLLSFLYAKTIRIPMIMWYAHGCINMKLRIAHLLVNKIITPSKESFRVKSNKVVIAGHGIDIEKFNPAISGTKLKIENKETKTILSVGRISPIKNYETLIKAADILINQKNIRNLRFQIVGGVPIKSQNMYLDFLKNRVKEYKLEDYVDFVGSISYMRICDYYQNCELFVSTSNTGSLDKAVLEAMACEKIALTSNEAFTDLLRIYSYILMFDKNNPNSLVEKIIHILEIDAEYRDNIGCKLREMVARAHNLNRFIDNILTVFNGAINNR